MEQSEPAEVVLLTAWLPLLELNTHHKARSYKNRKFTPSLYQNHLAGDLHFSNTPLTHLDNPFHAYR